MDYWEKEILIPSPFLRTTSADAMLADKMTENSILADEASRGVATAYWIGRNRGAQGTAELLKRMQWWRMGAWIFGLWTLGLLALVAWLLAT